MQKVREAVRIEEGLRSQRPPGVSRPKKSAAARTPPQTPLMVKLKCGGGQDNDNGQPRPKVSFVCCGHLWWAPEMSLTERVQTLGQSALAAGEHGRVAEREATRLGFAQLLN